MEFEKGISGREENMGKGLEIRNHMTRGRGRGRCNHFKVASE